MNFIPSRKGLLRKISAMVIILIAIISMAFNNTVIEPTFTKEITSAEVLTIPNMNSLSTDFPMLKDYRITLPKSNSVNIRETLKEIESKSKITKMNEDIKETEEVEEIKPEKTIDELVHDVDTGVAGNGDARKEYLGDKYDEVMKIINEKYSKPVEVKVSNTNTPSTSNVQPSSDYQSYAHDKLIERGFSEYDFECLVNLWNKESGWNPNSHNSSSGAHGIAQALPASKMASYGSDYYTNGYVQIDWGLDYIAGRYGSPANAWNHFLSKHWY